ncbi:hypothetical protein AOXY_G3469 [Acipenser oxyrinchus oxyrinchus]|uniref:Uncharacterized protein n=1 Tax=Acipenser oxyrinchus oxyrinchus TaxID=40147 RepID=A0AAD8LSI2_ACIOX|nr:hypothetical protein AOXY_G3469 [Acipenser oxyrinchus oxyrinchus]
MAQQTPEGAGAGCPSAGGGTPSASAVDPEPQPQSHPLLQEGMTYGHQPHVFSMPPKHSGTGKAAETPWGHGTDRSWTTRPHPTSSPSTSSAAPSFTISNLLF